MIKHALVIKRADSSWMRGMRLVAVFAVAFGLAVVSLWLGASTQRAAAIWPLNGLYLALLLRSPRRQWALLAPMVFFGNLVANLGFGDSLAIGLPLALVNQFEVIGSALLLSRAGHAATDLTRPQSIRRFVGFAVLLMPALSTVLATALIFEVNGATLAPTAIGWFVADALGVAVVTPLALTLRWSLIRLAWRQRSLDAVLPLLSLALTTTLVFSQNTFHMLFLVFPALLWVVSRLGLVGGSFGIVMLTIAALTAFTTHSGPFGQVVVDDGPLESDLINLIVLQLFLAAATVKVVAVSSVLTQRDRLRRKLQRDMRHFAHLAQLDGLTRIANRRQFDERLRAEWHRAWRDGLPLSLLMIDVDYFKRYNDHYGHLAGDDALRKIARALRGSLRRASDLVARYGGEEFAVILPNTTPAQAQVVGDYLRRAVRNLAVVHADSSAAPVITVSVGVAGITDVAGARQFPVEALIGSADAALYRAKRDGRDRTALQSGEVAEIPDVAA